jgi:hypothetical protein
MHANRVPSSWSSFRAGAILGNIAVCDRGHVPFKVGMGLAGCRVSSCHGFCNDVESLPKMNIFVTTMFLLPLVLVTRYLYVSGVFINRRAFQVAFSILLVLFALIIGIGGIQLSYQG